MKPKLNGLNERNDDININKYECDCAWLECRDGACWHYVCDFKCVYLRYLYGCVSKSGRESHRIVCHAIGFCLCVVVDGELNRA